MIDWEDILMIGGFSLSYYLGSKEGEKRIIKSMEEQNKQQEIQNLKDEIERLKKHLKVQGGTYEEPIIYPTSIEREHPGLGFSGYETISS